MPKIVTAKRREDEMDRARLYLKSRLMFPTIPLGMVTLLVGYGSVGLMWIQDELTPKVLLGSTILFVSGALWGWGHARYDRFLVRTCPDYLARKQKLLEAAKVMKRAKKDAAGAGPSHPGRRMVVAAYAIGVCAQLGLTVYYLPTVGVYPAVFLPWAGYLNAKVIALRDLFTS